VRRIVMSIGLAVLMWTTVFALELQLVCRLSTGGAPKSVEITPDGRFAYVCNLEGGSVWRYDVENRKVVKKIVFHRTPATGYDYKTKKPIPSFAEKPVECAFTDGGKRVWISLHNAEEVVVYCDTCDTCEVREGRRVRVYDLVDGTSREMYLRSIKVGKTPKIVCSSPDNMWVYVANWHSDNVSVIDARTYEVVKTIPVVRIPRGIVFSQDGKFAYIANMGSVFATKVDVKSGHRKVKNIKVGVNPRHLRISPDGRYLYATLNIPGRFVKVDLETSRVVGDIPIGKKPRGMVLSKDGKFAFVGLYDEDSLAVVDLSGMKVLYKVPTGHKPIGIAITPDGKELWVTNYFENTLFIYRIAPSAAPSEPVGSKE